MSTIGGNENMNSKNLFLCRAMYLLIVKTIVRADINHIPISKIEI
jgi:hypothetical protein